MKGLERHLMHSRPIFISLVLSRNGSYFVANFTNYLRNCVDFDITINDTSPQSTSLPYFRNHISGHLFARKLRRMN